VVEANAVQLNDRFIQILIILQNQGNRRIEWSQPAEIVRQLNSQRAGNVRAGKSRPRARIHHYHLVQLRV
jgi:hypothetical protein